MTNVTEQRPVVAGPTSIAGAILTRAKPLLIVADPLRLADLRSLLDDVPDTWEREGESKEYFDRFSPNGYAVGVNIVLYALTH